MLMLNQSEFVTDAWYGVLILFISVIFKEVEITDYILLFHFG
jgi:hypothetical protein